MTRLLTRLADVAYHWGRQLIPAALNLGVAPFSWRGWRGRGYRRDPRGRDRARRQVTVLVVEDPARLAASLARGLGEEGFSVDACGASCPRWHEAT